MTWHVATGLWPVNKDSNNSSSSSSCNGNTNASNSKIKTCFSSAGFITSNSVSTECPSSTRTKTPRSQPHRTRSRFASLRRFVFGPNPGYKYQQRLKHQGRFSNFSYISFPRTLCKNSFVSTMDSPRKDHTHRPHKRSSFRMPISRRFRSEFTPLPQSEPDSSDGGGRLEGGSRRDRHVGNKVVGLGGGSTPRADRGGVSPRRDRNAAAAATRTGQEETTRLLDKTETEEDDDENRDRHPKVGGKTLHLDFAVAGEEKPESRRAIEEGKRKRGRRKKKELSEESTESKTSGRELDLVAVAERRWRRRENFQLTSSSSVRGHSSRHRGSGDLSGQHQAKRGSGPCELQPPAPGTRSSFRSRRKSFGSESEKRRGERFQREREMERREREMGRKGASIPAPYPSDDDDDDDFFDFDFDAESSDSATHVCDFSCPLVLHGPCPKSLPGGKKKLRAQRRSSFASTSSRDGTIQPVHPHHSHHHHHHHHHQHHAGAAPGAAGHGSGGDHPSVSQRRFRPLASLSIEDLPGGVSGHYKESPLRSPGLLSTASMWSTSDLHQAGVAAAGCHGVSGLTHTRQGVTADAASQ
ncbi:hypothetical protein PoB_007326400 [Plakobranchus ocellatus]|uniref:Uncharacterized protein n=1 Tax=Plakobranchus ocellatus TaxID=259542 RepID=A0AAV4DRE3_9GAST|nr:hypothetical protein PoB_007326400 [Plakobranchus ocellatus]